MGKIAVHLSSKQRALLYVVYRFRFVTVEGLTQYLHLTSRNSLRARLNVLVRAGYLMREYEPSHSLLRTSAFYSLSRKGRQTLHDYPGVSTAGLNAIYKNPTVSWHHKNRCLAILAVAARLASIKGTHRQFLLRHELSNYWLLADIKPDAVLMVQRSGSAPVYFFIELFDTTQPRFATKYRLQTYDDYFTYSGWRQVAGPLPTVICICETLTVQRRITRQLAVLEMTDIYEDNFQVLVRP